MVVVDRLVARADHKGRIVDSLEQALRFGKGGLVLVFPDQDGRREPHVARLECPRCRLAYREPTSNLFSFNSPLAPATPAAASAASSTSTSISSSRIRARRWPAA